MTLPSEEPELGPWEGADVEAIADRLLRRARKRHRGVDRAGPPVVAVDGRSASGKSTCAHLLAGAVPSAAVVHTDDVAWWHGFFDWQTLLVDGVLAPLSRGEEVSFRPPAWVERMRAGAIDVPAGVAVVLVEGVGSSQQELAPWLDASVWVQSDLAEARRRGIQRDVAQGRSPEEAEAFWDEWEAQEMPFLAADRPWERADVLLCGTPDPDGALVAAQPGQLLVSARR
jgi:energy-coupling factor transporter ATP-binding protein EcfA2